VSGILPIKSVSATHANRNGIEGRQQSVFCSGLITAKAFEIPAIAIQEPVIDMGYRIYAAFPVGFLDVPVNHAAPLSINSKYAPSMTSIRFRNRAMRG
jgi:hypothetical protein